MSNIWRPIDFDSLGSQTNENDISVVEISSEELNQEKEEDHADSFGPLPEGK